MQEKAIDTADKAVDVLTKIIESISNMAPGLWEASVRHHYVSAISDLVFGFIGSIVLGATAIMLYKLEMKNVERKRRINDKSDDPGYLVACAIATIFFGVFFLKNMFDVSENIATISAPEYAAIESLIESLRE